MSEATVIKMRPDHAKAIPVQAADLWRGWSLEATLPTNADITSLDNKIAPGTRIYLSALPRGRHSTQIEAAKTARQAGFEPVPHLSARKFRDRAEFKSHVNALRDEAGVTNVLVVAGDLPSPQGPFDDAMALLRDDALLTSGIEQIGISGYPEGHPVVGTDALDKHMAKKIDWISRAGISVEIVTQFCFDAQSVTEWYQRLRGHGIVVPIRIGLAGPASPSTLVKLALRCGVNLPLRQTNVAMKLLKGMSADDMVCDLVDSPLVVDADRVFFHFYSFGGLKRTAQWAHLAEQDSQTNF